MSVSGECDDVTQGSSSHEESPAATDEEHDVSECIEKIEKSADGKTMEVGYMVTI